MSRRIFRYLLPLLAVQFAFVSCLDINDASYRKHTVAVIMNQGGTGSATLSYYNEDSNELDNDIYERVNGKQIGATGQDMIITPFGSIYLMCTSPDKIEMINPKSMSSYTTITEGILHPRNLREHEGLLYVVNDGDRDVSFISVYNLSTNAYIDSIELDTRAEDIVVKKDVAYVTTEKGLLMLDVKDAMFKDGIKPIGIKEVPSHDNPAMTADLLETGFAVSYPGAGVAVFSEKGDLTTFIKMPMDQTGFITPDAQVKRIAHNYKDPVSGVSTVYSAELKDGMGLKEEASGENITGFGFSTSSKDLFVCETPSAGNSVLKIYRRGRKIYEAEVGQSATRLVFYNYTEVISDDSEDEED